MARSTPAQVFDLRASQPRREAGERPLVEFLLALGLGLTGVGVATVAYLSFTQGNPGFAFDAAIVGAFAIGGFSPSAIYLASKPWRRLMTLEINEEGATLIDSGGRRTLVAWRGEPAGIAILERIRGSSPAVGPAGTGERVLVEPGRLFGYVTPEARTAWIGAAARHGWAVNEERYTQFDGRRRDRLVECVERSASTRASPAPPPSTEDPLASEVLGSDRPAVSGFDVGDLGSEPWVERSTASPNPFRTVEVDAEGLAVHARDGSVKRAAWTTPRLRFRLWSWPGTVATPLDDPALLWQLSLPALGLRGRVGGPCYRAIVREAQSNGLWAVTSKIPIHSRQHRGQWVASTEVLSPPGSGGPPR